MSTINTNALDHLFDSVGSCLTPDVASKLADLKVARDLQEQLDGWAEQSSSGQISSDDREQYEAVLRGLNFIAVLQAKAKRISNATDSGSR